MSRTKPAGVAPAAADKVNVLGILVDPTNMAKATAKIVSWIEQKQRAFVCVTGVHGIMESLRQPDLARIHNTAGMVVPDGMPLVYISRDAGHPDCGRVYGPDLMLEVCRVSVARGYRHYFYGTTEQTLALLTARLEALFPGIDIAGTCAPPFRPLSDCELAETLSDINASRADIVWVGLSTPKQERWMAAQRHAIDASVLIGVGAAFDFHAGTVRQAPKWVQPLCLEWAFRLLVEPRRLWKRYLFNNPKFLVLFALQRLGLRAY